MWALVPSPCTYASTVIWGSGQRANSQHTDKLSPDRYRAWQLNGSQRDVLLTMRQLWEPITAVTCLEAAPPPCINLKLRANSSCQEGVKARNLSFKIKVVCISVNVFIGTDCFRNCWSVIFCFTCQQCNILEELPSLYFISAFMWQMNWTEARCKIIHGLFTVLQTANVDWVVFVFIVLFSKAFHWQGKFVLELGNFCSNYSPFSNGETFQCNCFVNLRAAAKPLWPPVNFNNTVCSVLCKLFKCFLMMQLSSQQAKNSVGLIE